MSDLSNLLGDVYGDASPDGPSVRREPAASERGNEFDVEAPSWSSESSLDRAFNGWVPGEAPGDGDLTEALASALATPAPAPAPVYAPAPQAPTLAETISEIAPARAPWTAPIDLTVEAPAPVREMATVGAARSWMPGDDDIFPAGKKSKR